LAAASRDTASRLRFSMAGILAVVSQSIVGAKPLTQPWSISRHSNHRIGHGLSATGKKVKNLGHWSFVIGHWSLVIGYRSLISGQWRIMGGRQVVEPTAAVFLREGRILGWADVAVGVR
jgi:hypothetical protein